MLLLLLSFGQLTCRPSFSVVVCWVSDCLRDRETGDAVISAADIVMYMTSKERLLNEQDRQELRRIHDRNPSKTFVVGT